MVTFTLNGQSHFIAPDAVGDLTVWRGTHTDEYPLPVTDERTCDPNLWAHLVTMAHRASQRQYDDTGIPDPDAP
jgi:hypothetical protein